VFQRAENGSSSSLRRGIYEADENAELVGIGAQMEVTMNVYSESLYYPSPSCDMPDQPNSETRALTLAAVLHAGVGSQQGTILDLAQVSKRKAKSGF